MKAEERRFGIEIECFLPREHVAAGGDYHKGQYHRGEPVEGVYKGIDTPKEEEVRGWNVQDDASLHGSAFASAEVVSGILQGEEGLTEVAYFIQDLVEHNAEVNDTCGLHVHVEAGDLTHGDVAKIKAAFIRYEKAFFALNGEKAYMRWGRSYCANSTTWDMADYTPGGGAHDILRYRSLNLTRYFNLTESKKTVEFRLFASTLNDGAIMAAISMCVALVSWAIGHDMAAGRIEDPQQAVAEFSKTVLRKNYMVYPHPTMAKEVAYILKEQAEQAGSF